MRPAAHRHADVASTVSGSPDTSGCHQARPLALGDPPIGAGRRDPARSCATFWGVSLMQSGTLFGRFGIVRAAAAVAVEQLATHVRGVDFAAYPRPRASSGSSARSRRRALPTPSGHLFERFVVPEGHIIRLPFQLPGLRLRPRQSYSSECHCSRSRDAKTRLAPASRSITVQDPFYHKQKRRKKARMLDGGRLARLRDVRVLAVARPRLHARPGFLLAFQRLGHQAVLRRDPVGRPELSAPSARSLDDWPSRCRPSRPPPRGQFNKAEDISVVFLDRYGNEIGRRGIRSDDSVSARQAARLFRQGRPSPPKTGASTTISASTSSAPCARSSTTARATTGTQGGSSITQQLAKNLFLTSERTLERKIKEAFLAVWLEWHYTKDEILKLYFDRAYMGGGNFGVAAASEYYFGKKITDVNLAEAAMLAGLFKAPTNYAPARRPRRCPRPRQPRALQPRRRRLPDRGPGHRRPPQPGHAGRPRRDDSNSPNYFLD